MSATSIHTVNTAYFGKIPARGDFVKSGTHPQLMASLDGWVARAMEKLGEDPHWKTLYDGLEPIRFAFLGSRSRLAIAGYLHPSRDQSGRRFPFLCATSLPVADSLDFITRSPMAFSRIWNAMERLTRELVISQDSASALRALDGLAGEVRTEADDGFDAFIDLQTTEGITGMLRQHGHDIDLHDVVLALGALLAPLSASGRSQADRGLLLPLPGDPLYINLTAAFWLSFVTPFLAKANFELATFMLNRDGRRQLAIGLRGAHPTDLSSLMSTPDSLHETFLKLDHPAWAAPLATQDAGKAKLSSYLKQPGLSLRTVHDTFTEVYTGA